jgi:hypothetical protein
MICRIDLEAFRSGRGLPNVSVLSGSREHVVLAPVRAVDPVVESVPLVAVLFGPLTALIFAAFGRTGRGMLPLSRSEARRLRKITRLRSTATALYLSLVLLVAIVTGLVSVPGWLTAVAVAVVFGGPVVLLLVVVGTQSKVPHVVLEAECVRIMNAAPQFCAAV